MRLAGTARKPRDQPFVNWSWTSIVPWSAIERTMNEFGLAMP
jgi:hypothetical protein